MCIRDRVLCLPETALDLITDKTLLIIIDTHTEALVESKAVYERCKQIIVIDHQRKLVNQDVYKRQPQCRYTPIRTADIGAM